MNHFKIKKEVITIGFAELFNGPTKKALNLFFFFLGRINNDVLGPVDIATASDHSICDNLYTSLLVLGL